MTKKKNAQDATRSQVKWKLSRRDYDRDQRRIEKRLKDIEAGLRSLLADN